MKGRLHTRYAPVRRSLAPKNYTPRLACVKPAASVHPEPGSNSSSYILILYIRCLSSGSFRILRLYYSYSFCLVVKQDGCQFNMSTNVFYFLRLFLKAGAKLKLLFVSRKKNLIKFRNFFFASFSSILLPISQ